MGRRKKSSTVEVHHGLYLKRNEDGQPWQCYFRLNEQAFRRSTKTAELAEAKIVALSWFQSSKEKASSQKPIQKISFAELTSLYLQSIATESKYVYQKETIDRHFLPFFKKYADVYNIKTSDYQDYVIYRKKKNRSLPQTLNRENTVLRQLFLFAEKRDLLGHKIIIDYLNERQHRIRRPSFTASQYLHLCNVAEERIKAAAEKKSSRLVLRQRQLLYDFIKVLITTGMRVDEAKSLRWKNVDIEDKSLKLEFAGKTKSFRRLWVRNSGILALKRIKARRLAYLSETGVDEIDPNEQVFSLDNGMPIKSFKKGFDALLKAAGFEYPNIREKHTLTSFRHSYATFRLTTKRDKRATVRMLSVQMGTSVRMIEQHYGHDELNDYEEELAGRNHTKSK